MAVMFRGSIWGVQPFRVWGVQLFRVQRFIFLVGRFCAFLLCVCVWGRWFSMGLSLWGLLLVLLLVGGETSLVVVL